MRDYFYKLENWQRNFCSKVLHTKTLLYIAKITWKSVITIHIITIDMPSHWHVNRGPTFPCPPKDRP